MIFRKNLLSPLALLCVFTAAAQGAELPALSEPVAVPVPVLSRVEAPVPSIIAFFKNRTSESDLPPVVTKKAIEAALAEMKLTLVSVAEDGMYYLAIDDPKDAEAIRANMQRHPYVLSAAPAAWAKMTGEVVELDFKPSASDDERKELLRLNDAVIVKALSRKNAYWLACEGPVSVDAMAAKLSAHKIVKAAVARH